MIFVKDELNKYDDIIESDSKYVFCIKIRKFSQSLIRTLYSILDSIYVPPSQSRFLNEHEFENFQGDIMTICRKYHYVFISGDMNAQTANLTEFTSPGDFLGRHFQFDDNLIQFYDQKSVLDKNIQVQRKSMDKKKNNNGYKLIEICKNHNLIILNGRYGKDKKNQLLQLCTARTAWSDSVIRSETSLITESDRSGPIR